jgi:hypothetical protein
MSYSRLSERVSEKVDFVKSYGQHLANVGSNILRDEFKKSRLREVPFKKGGANSTYEE